MQSPLPPLPAPSSPALLYHSSPTSMSNICTKSELPVYPFATQSSALLICSAKGQRGESKRESRESKRRERETGRVKWERDDAAYHWRKSAARGVHWLSTLLAAPPSPPPTPLPTCTFCSRISLAGSVARQRAVSIENSRGSTEKVVFAAKEAAREKERGRKGRFTEKSRQKEIILNAA